MSETNDSRTNDLLDDPRLTAYALGELTGDDLRKIETLVASNAEARRAVDEIRATASLVAAELGAAGGEALTPEQRAKITARAAAPTNVVPMRRLYWTAAASLIVGATAGFAASRTWNRDATKRLDVADAGRFRDGDRERAQANAVLRKVQPAMSKLNESKARFAESGGGGGHAAEDPFLGSGMTGGGGGGGGPQVANVPPQTKPAEPAKPADRPRPGEGSKSKYAGPKVESAPDTRQPSDPPPPPERGGPGTPGGVGNDANVFHDFHKLTPEQKKQQDELFAAEIAAGKTPAEAAVKLKCINLQLDGTVSADDLAGFDNSTLMDATTAQYAHIEDNPFRLVKDAPLSTFGADVDTASYSNVRRFLNSRQLPPPGAVRIEEMVNYFPYDYAPPTDGRPFAVRVDVAGCPWKTDHRLVRIGIKGKVVASAARPAANLVFLLDVSGSMSPAERLPLVIESMKLLVGKLEAKDRVAIVVYAGASGLALPSTSCEDKSTILAALERLHAGGSTNGAAGIELAYQVAAQNRIEGGVNRVILATDGDFNVGVSDESSLVKLIEEKRKSGVFLSVLGVGADNLKDAQMEKLADKGNGQYAYVDTLKEGQKVLVEEAEGTLNTIAKDVKFQVEFNPAQVGSWRLIGYENRVLAAEDFKDDKKDAGEIGAGHTVTALYEVVPPGVLTDTAGVEPLKYQQPPAPTGPLSNELLTVKLRWKAPDSDVSTPAEFPVIDEGLGYSAASPDFKFAASVAAFGMCLRGSPHKGQANLMAVLELATEGAANDPGGYRHEFVDLVKRAVELGAK